MTVPGITRHPVFYLKHNVTETGFRLRLQAEPTQLITIDRDRFHVKPVRGRFHVKPVTGRFHVKPVTGRFHVKSVTELRLLHVVI
jgi:hypothetical protein